MKLFTLIDVSFSGTLGSLHVKSLKWTNITSENLEKLDFISEITNLLPEVVHEMEKLKGLTVDRSKPEEEQKKQADFIQQRKRARLNELFKTLQNYGFSYRYGVTNYVDIYNTDRSPSFKSVSEIQRCVRGQVPAGVHVGRLSARPDQYQEHWPASKPQTRSPGDGRVTNEGR